MLLFSKIYEFYCLYGIEILLSGATGAAKIHMRGFIYFHMRSFIRRASYTVKKIGASLFPTFSHFFPLFLNSSYEAVIYILLTLDFKEGESGPIFGKFVLRNEF